MEQAAAGSRPAEATYPLADFLKGIMLLAHFASLWMQNLHFLHETVKDIQMKKHGMRESGVFLELKTGETVSP